MMETLSLNSAEQRKAPILKTLSMSARVALLLSCLVTTLLMLPQRIQSSSKVRNPWPLLGFALTPMPKQMPGLPTCSC